MQPTTNAPRFLYVGAIPYGANESTIRELFEPFGPVLQVHVNADWENPTYEPHAYVELQDIKAAIGNMDGRKVGNTYLRVHETGDNEN